MKDIKVSVIGLGVGYGVAVTLASAGYKIVGIDINEKAIKTPRTDKTIEEFKKKYPDVDKSLTLSTDYSLVKNSDFIFVCVNTDFDDRTKTLTTGHVQDAINNIEKHNRHGIIVILSTLPIGASDNFTVDHKRYAYSPMLLAQGELVPTLLHPPFLAVGAYDPETANRVITFYKEWYSKVNGIIPSDWILTPIEAETLKFSYNFYATMRMNYANLVGDFCEDRGIDGNRIMNILASMNLGNRFFRPGYAVAGACFPRDARAFRNTVKKSNNPTEIFDAVMSYNAQRGQHPLTVCRNEILHNHHRVVILGLAYKSGIYDTRESASLRLMNSLKRRHHPVIGYDPNLEHYNNKPILVDNDIVVIINREQEFVDLLNNNADKQLTILDYAGQLDHYNNGKWKVWKAGMGWINR